MKPFKQEFTFNERVQESAAMIANYPARVPFGISCLMNMELLVFGYLQVIVERFSSSNLPQMEKRKYLVPCDMPVGQFIFILRSRLHLSPGTALFVFVNNTLPQTGSLQSIRETGHFGEVERGVVLREASLGSLYDAYKDKDGFLYMCYSSEKTFGCLA